MIKLALRVACRVVSANPPPHLTRSQSREKSRLFCVDLLTPGLVQIEVIDLRMQRYLDVSWQIRVVKICYGLLI